MIRQLARSVRQMGLAPAISVHLARASLLPRILRCRPIEVPRNGPLEVHMLLSGSRALEAMWTMYSLLRASGRSFPIVVHDDGTLDATQRDRLQRVFPGINTVERREADQRMHSALGGKGLARSAALRDQLIFALKLFDVCEIAEADNILLLDADVLFFRDPVELLDLEWGGSHVHQRDFAKSYCLSAHEMGGLEGPFPVPQLNPGIMRISRQAVSFERVEGYLASPSFYDADGRPNYFAELTTWALEVSQRPNSELPRTYGIGTSPWVMPEVVAGHFCGGGYWAGTFYSKGIRELARRGEFALFKSTGISA